MYSLHDGCCYGHFLKNLRIPPKKEEEIKPHGVSVFCCFQCVTIYVNSIFVFICLCVACVCVCVGIVCVCVCKCVCVYVWCLVCVLGVGCVCVVCYNSVIHMSCTR